MGVKHAHKLTYSLDGLSLARVELIAQARFLEVKSNRNVKISQMQQPTIDVDISWLYRSKGHIQEENRISYAINICLLFARVGFSVVLVCDGGQRHHSKRATIERHCKMYENTIAMYVSRAKLMQLCRQRLQSNSVEEKATILEDEKRIGQKVKKFEKAEQGEKINVGENFYQDLCQHVDGLPHQEFGTRGGNIFVIQAEFQADAVIAHRMVNRITDIALSNDSDLASLAGPDCVCIKELHYANNEITSLNLFFAFESTMLKIMEKLMMDNDTPNIIIKNAECPIYDGIQSYQLRALISVGLGCDVFTFGIKQLRKADFNMMLKSRLEAVSNNYAQLYDMTISYLFENYWKQQSNTINDWNRKLESKTQFTNTMNIFVQCIVYEPANYNTPYPEVALDNCHNIYIYNKPPSALHKYVEAFARGNTGTSDGKISIYGGEDTLCTCVGPGNGTHPFLHFENGVRCKTCQRSCCYSCIFGETQIKKNIASTASWKK